MAKAKKRSPNTTKKTAPTIKDRHLGEISDRIWMLLNYLSITVGSALVFGVTAYCEYLLTGFVWGLLTDDLKQSQLIEWIGYWTQVAVFTISMVGFVIHSTYSLYGQYKIERQISVDKSVDSEA